MTDFHIIASSPAMTGELLHGARIAGVRFAGIVLPFFPAVSGMLPSFADDVRKCALYAGIEAAAGVEIRGCPAAILPELVGQAREAGAEFVVCLGEGNGMRPEQGLNIAAVEAGADILSRPGVLDAETSACAAEKDVCLEFTACPGAAFANARTTAMAEKFGFGLVRGSEAGRAGEIASMAAWSVIAAGADVSDSKSPGACVMAILRSGEERLVRRILAARGRK